MSKEKISKYLLSSCNKTLRLKMENYLFEEQDIEFSKSELNKIKFYNYFLFLELDIFNKNKTMKKSEDSTIIKRLLTLGYNYCPEKLILDLSTCNFNNRMTIYKNLGVSDEFLAKDLEYTFNNFEDERILFSMIEDINKKFPKFVDYYLSLEDTEKNRYIVGKILELKCSIDNENIILLENFILNSLCEIYSSERIENILNYDFKNYELANSIKDISIINDDENLIYFLKNIHTNLNIESKNKKTILGVFEILTFSDSLDFLELENPKEYFDKVNNSTLPFIYKLVYLYKGSEDYNITFYIQKFILDNSEKSLEILDRMLKQNIELGAFILGTLIDNKIISEELKAKYIDNFKNNVASLINVLEETKDRELGVELINTLGYMLTYSNVEEYIAKLSDSYDENRWDINEFINMIAHFERLENNGKNPWKIIAEKTSISKKFLISGTADFVNISSEEQFTEFLKENKEYFYELLEKKTFIDYTFEEILNLSYRSDKSFDVTKLFPYLSISDEIILETLFEILKDKEKECSDEVEKLTKTKNKKILANIKALKKVWESNKGKKIKTYSQLEDYILSIFDNYKKDILYPKSEAYFKIREKDSETFIDERVIKMYVALYMYNNDLEDIELGKTIRNFVNLEDLNKCLDTLFDTWLQDNSPVHTSSIVRTYLLTADDYGIDKILDLLEKAILKSKTQLAKNLLSIFFSIKKQELNTEIKFIKSKIHHTDLGEVLRRIREEDDSDVTSEILAPNIDFSMGFDANGEKFFNYGNRKIKLVLNENFDIIMYNQDDKEVRSLPKYSSKFEDDENRVEFYQKEIKRFKKKKEILLSEIKKYMFYQMIGNRVWSIEEWNKEINSSYFIKGISKNILWTIISDSKEYYCKYDREKFIDIHSNKIINQIENIKIFYQGETDIETTIFTKNITPFLPQQFSIVKIEVANLDDYKGLPLSLKKINTVINNYFAEIYSSILYGDNFTLIDKLTHTYLEIPFTFSTKSQNIQDIKVSKIFKDEISLEEVNPRFLNFIYFILKEITTLDM